MVYDPSFDTLDLPQPQITPSKQRKAGAPLGSVPKNRRPLSQPELVGQRFGSVTIISPQAVWLGRKERRHMHVLCECVTCGYRSVIAYSNLTGGRTKGCRPCNQPKRFPTWLYQRADAMKQRCRNPAAQQYANYGGRGIEFRFDSPTSCALWIVENLPLPPNARDLELDRKDTDGHYEPGNLRWATKQLNNCNRRDSKWAPLMHKFRLEHPDIRYSDATLRGLLAAGLDFGRVIARYNQPSFKPKGKYGTYLKPDLAIASLVKDS